MIYSDSWILKEPIDSFFFDCDGTLSLVEGIDVLADANHVGEQVHKITNRCMAQTGMSVTDYRHRLELVKPTNKQVDDLAQIYVDNCAQGARETISVLLGLDKKVYILSAGIKAAVVKFAQTLGISADKVLAVDVYFGEQGIYTGFNEHSNLVQPGGKAVEIASILKPGERSLLVGDGMSDWEARDAVTRFIGFAGLSPKVSVQNNSDFFISNTSLYPIIPMGLTEKEALYLNPEQQAYYLEGITDIRNAKVLIKEKDRDQRASIR